MPQDTCTLEGCDSRRKYRLYCKRHYNRARANGGDPGPVEALVMSRDGGCSVDGCGAPIRSRGLCESHYGMLLRRGTTERYVHEVKPCSAEGCERDAWNRGMCSKHYSRWMKYGTTELPERVLNRDLRCDVDGCERNRHVGPHCQAHHRRFRRYGDPLGEAPPRPAPAHEDIFWKNTPRGRDDDCWPWQGTVSSQGYGVYVIRGVQYKAHRQACSIGLGRPIAADKMACHRCSNPICVNPSHLYEGDSDSNADDMVAAGNSLRGTRNAKNLLTPDQVQEIRLHRGHTVGREVAARYGVSLSAVMSIWHGRNWKWLPWPDAADRAARRR